MLDFPATHKNREPIVEVLGQIFDPEAELKLLEIASGSGQHAAFFAHQFPKWTLQPTDLEPEHLQSIDAFREYHQLTNVLPAIQLDACNWTSEEKYNGILAINLIHISPWQATLGLLEGASKHLKPGGKLYLYGAYRRDGEHTSESNFHFDQGLRARNPEWGVRCLNEVTEAAKPHGFNLHQVVQMPANNLSVVFDLGS